MLPVDVELEAQRAAEAGATAGLALFANDSTADPRRPVDVRRRPGNALEGRAPPAAAPPP